MIVASKQVPAVYSFQPWSIKATLIPEHLVALCFLPESFQGAAQFLTFLYLRSPLDLLSSAFPGLGGSSQTGRGLSRSTSSSPLSTSSSPSSLLSSPWLLLRKRQVFYILNKKYIFIVHSFYSYWPWHHCYCYPCLLYFHCLEKQTQSYPEYEQ